MAKPFVLIANATESLHGGIADALTWCRTGTAQALSARDLVAAMQRLSPALIVLGPALDGWSSLDLARGVRQCNKTIALLLMPRESSEELAIAALQAGFNEYVKCSPSLQELIENLVRAVERCLGSAAAEDRGYSRRLHLVGGERMVGDSESMRCLRTRLENIAA